LIILAVPLLLLWFMVTRGRKQQRELSATQDALVPGSRIMTSSGLFAEVVEVEDDAVVLEIAPGVHTRWNKRAIGQVLPVTEDGPAEDDPAEDDLAEDDPAENIDSPQDIEDSDSAEDAGPIVAPGGNSGLKSTEDVRSEAGYAVFPEADATEGSTGTTGTTRTPGTTGITGTDGR
jgi:preprotein translocase subunit YajC